MCCFSDIVLAFDLEYKMCILQQWSSLKILKNRKCPCGITFGEVTTHMNIKWGQWNSLNFHIPYDKSLSKLEPHEVTNYYNDTPSFLKITETSLLVYFLELIPLSAKNRYLLSIYLLLSYYIWNYYFWIFNHLSFSFLRIFFYIFYLDGSIALSWKRYFD